MSNKEKFEGFDFSHNPYEQEARERWGDAAVDKANTKLHTMSKPALLTVAVLQFMTAWNDFMGPLIYLNDQENYTLSIGIQQFQAAYDTQWNLLMAATVLMILPMITLFFLAQRYFIEGIATTGLKG